MLPFLGSSLLPDFKERDFLMHWLTKPGTSLPEETRISKLACRELREVPGVRNCGSHIGQALFADEVVGVDFGENWISVDPEADYDATLADVQEVVDGYPGLYRDVLTYLRERVKEVLTGTSETLVVRIYGADLAVLRTTADDVNAALQDVEGLIDLHVELVEDIPHVAVEVDLKAAGRHGLKPGEIRRAAAVLMQSIEVNDIWRAFAGLRRQRLEHARDAKQPHEHPEPADPHAERRDRPAGGGCRRAGRADAQRHQARERLAPDRRRRERRREATSARLPRRSRSGWRRSTSRSATPPSSWASRPSGTRLRTACGSTPSLLRS